MKCGTYTDFAEPHIATLCAKIFHAVQCQLTEIPRVLASAGN